MFQSTSLSFYFHQSNDVNSLSNIVVEFFVISRGCCPQSSACIHQGICKNKKQFAAVGFQIETTNITQTVFTYHTTHFSVTNSTLLIDKMPKNFFKDTLCLCYSTPKKRNPDYQRNDDIYSRPMLRQSPKSQNGQVRFLIL